jgi:UDPglucose--hexose-1-phosphate uridylyltransferase
LIEIRKDYFRDSLCIVGDEGLERVYLDIGGGEEVCPYCAGNEHLTQPAELVLVQSQGTLVKKSDTEEERVKNWSIRVIPSRKPFVSTSSDSRFTDHPLYSEPAFGYHYEVVATPNHKESLSTISVDQWANLLRVIQDRMKWLYSRKGVAYVSVYAEQGKGHARFDLVTLPKLPPIVEQEANAFHSTYRETAICPMCNVIAVETGGPRQIHLSEHYIVFAPWAPSSLYEFWIFPRKHQTSFLKIGQKEIDNLALTMRAALGAFDKAFNSTPYTIVLHSSSEKKTSKQLHWHFEVHANIPFENALHVGTGIYFNPVSPEKVASRLSSTFKREFASLVGVS